MTQGPESDPMGDAQPRHQLHALLKDFDAALASEYEAVRQRDTARLEAAVAEKLRLAGDLERLTPQVQPPTTAGDPREREQWAQIQALLGRCALANRTNGAAIDASRSFMTSMLDLLSGRRPNERTYTAAGRLSRETAAVRFERV
ncbi:MAG: flagellar export chaperone FlgN [Gammaproteobacteria bacterium]